MSDIEKEFVPYEQALALKELGFDEPCLAKYAIYNPKDPIKLLPQSQDFFKGCFSYCRNSDYSDKIAAPTFSQAFKYFRQKYGLQSYIRHECPDVESYYGFVINEDIYDVMKDTHEKAELACLRKLIEIVKNKTT